METLCDSTGPATATRDITGNDGLMPGALSVIAEGDQQPSPDVVMQNTTIMDITDDFLWMERSRWLTAEAYAALANPKLGLAIEDLFELVSKDCYEQQGRARTFAALTTDPETGATEIIGLVRLVFGASRGEHEHVYPISAMHFVEALDGWPHQQMGLAEDQIAELGRFLIIERCRAPEMRRAGVTARLTRGLHDAAVEAMRSKHGRILYAIMPSYMARLTTQAGPQMRQVECRLRTEDESAAHMFDQLSLYWQHARPKLYYFPDAPAPLCAASGSSSK